MLFWICMKHSLAVFLHFLHFTSKQICLTPLIKGTVYISTDVTF